MKSILKVALKPSEIRAMHPCDDRYLKIAIRRLGGVKKVDDKPITVGQALKVGVAPWCIEWVLNNMAANDAVDARITGYANEEATFDEVYSHVDSGMTAKQIVKWKSERFSYWLTAKNPKPFKLKIVN